MRVSTLFGSPLKESPADTEFVSHELLLRAGYVRQLGAGMFSYLPLAWRSIRKIQQILREEMDRIEGQELNMPVVHPAEVWQATGRYDQIGSEMVRLRDRRDGELVLAMTHEEVVVDLARTEIKSYRQLPSLVYQMQTKFRDEPRARGGLIRVREFIMKDSYSLDRNLEGLVKQYEAHHDAYFRIFARCGLPVVVVASDPGMMGGNIAHEYMYVSPIGEDHLVLCAACGHSANREIAEFKGTADSDGEALPMEEVETPDTKTIAALAEFLGVKASQTAKVVLQTASFDDDRADRVVMAIVRGDREVNPIALQKVLGASSIRASDADELEGKGIVPGYASAIGIDRSKVTVVVDTLVRDSKNLVAGANKEGVHLRNTNYGRDYTADSVESLCFAVAGDGCPDCGEPLHIDRGVEVGNIFQLGTRYSAAVGANFLDNDGRAKPIVMGSYGIGVGRLLACVAESHHDDGGLQLPIAIAPFEVNLVALFRKAPLLEKAEAFYQELKKEGVEVLFDDRPKVSPGFKFAESDLRGIPLRVVFSDRGFTAGTVELKRRSGGDAWTVPLDEAIDAIKAELKSMWEAHDAGMEGLPTWADRNQ